MRILVYAEKDWSYNNFRPVRLTDPTHHYIRWFLPRLPSFPFDLALTCEPNIESWRKLYPQIKGRVPILALQQGMYWTDTPAAKAEWLFDKIMVWGQQMRESCLVNGLSDGRIVVTGNPGFDSCFAATHRDDDYSLVLGSRFEGTSHGLRTIAFQKYPDSEIVLRAHPAEPVQSPDPRYLESTASLIQNASRVLFSYTGAGIMAMIMKKPCYVVPGRARTYEKAPAYNAGKFVSNNDDFVRWAVTGPGSTERVIQCVHSHLT